MNILEYTKPLREERMNLFDQVTAIHDEAITAKRALTPEESQKVARMDERIAEIEAQVKDADQGETRRKDAAVAREAFDRQYGTGSSERNDRKAVAEFRDWAMGNVKRQDSDDPKDAGRNTWAVDLRGVAREYDLIRQGASPQEVRALLWDTGSIASAVPTTLSRTLYQYLLAGIAAYRMPTTKFDTSSGEPLQFPREATVGAATQVIAQGTAIGGTDPTFDHVQFDAYKYGELVQVASEVLQDTVFDVESYLGRRIGTNTARLIDQYLVVGTGSGQPQGMMTALAVGAAGTVATGGSLITPTYENLVDLVYSVNDAYRSSGNAAWLMRDATAGNIRKLRDGAGGTVGAVLWNPSLTSGIQFGQPDRLLDFPVYTDPNVAALGSAAKIVAFGDFSSYHIRNVGNFIIDRSDDYAFNVDEVTFRGKQRVDGDYLDLTAVNLLRQAVT